ncbi:MAG: hypothetical protein LBM38_00665 [Clostridiales bacterium]|jgi:hypothetical protein|nr:hypothetical protein [Clostridiales bacterium]
MNIQDYLKNQDKHFDIRPVTKDDKWCEIDEQSAGTRDRLSQNLPPYGEIISTTLPKSKALKMIRTSVQGSILRCRTFKGRIEIQVVPNKKLNNYVLLSHTKQNGKQNSKKRQINIVNKSENAKKKNIENSTNAKDIITANSKEHDPNMAFKVLFAERGEVKALKAIKLSDESKQALRNYDEAKARAVSDPSESPYQSLKAVRDITRPHEAMQELADNVSFQNSVVDYLYKSVNRELPRLLAKKASAKAYNGIPYTELAKALDKMGKSDLYDLIHNYAEKITGLNVPKCDRQMPQVGANSDMPRIQPWGK